MAGKESSLLVACQGQGCESAPANKQGGSRCGIQAARSLPGHNHGNGLALRGWSWEEGSPRGHEPALAEEHICVRKLETL